MVYSKYHSRKNNASQRLFSARRLGWIFFLLTTSSVAALALAKWMVGNEVLKLKQVYVEGTHFTDKGRILELAQVDTSKNLYEVDFDRIAERVRAHPFVRDVEVKFRLPSSLVIEVIEREPLAVVAGSRLVAIDDAGKPLPESTPRHVHDCPVISNLRIPERNQNQESAFEKVVTFLRETRNRNFMLYSQISEVFCSDRVGIYFYLTTGAIPVFVGDGEFVEKGANLLTVYRVIESEQGLSNVEYFDLRFKNQIVVKQLNPGT